MTIPSSNEPRTGAKILVDQLLIQGVTQVFCVPGESYLAVLDALYDVRQRIHLTVNRHESGASFMAEAWGKLSGQCGICMVTRGPGATNASIGIQTAYQDSTPMILLIGQVGTDFIDREAFQEIDYRRMFAPFCKWVAQIDRADRVSEYMARAFQIALSGRPGPVVLALPEDMLTQSVVSTDARRINLAPASPSPEAVLEMQRLLAQARNPLVILGGTGWTPQACAHIEQFAQTQRLGIAASFRRQDLFDNRHQNYIGDVGIGINPRLAERIRAADVVVAIGARLGEMASSGYTLFEVPQPRQQLIHVLPGAEELGRVIQTTLSIQSSMPAIAKALSEWPALGNEAWAEELTEARAQYLAWQAEPVVFAQKPQALNLWRVMRHLWERLPEETLLANGAGNFATWGHRFRQYPGFVTGRHSQLAPTSGAMGYGLPAALAAAIFDRSQTVVNLTGDGDFLMTGQELATAVMEHVAILILVVNNGFYGTIRMHQEREYPKRVYGTSLQNPDFSALSRAYGAFGAQVRSHEEFPAALDAALSSMRSTGLPALLELIVEPSILSPNMTIPA